MDGSWRNLSVITRYDLNPGLFYLLSPSTDGNTDRPVGVGGHLVPTLNTELQIEFLWRWWLGSGQMSERAGVVDELAEYCSNENEQQHPAVGVDSFDDASLCRMRGR
jgi:hypothetical protein